MHVLPQEESAEQMGALEGGGHGEHVLVSFRSGL